MSKKKILDEYLQIVQEESQEENLNEIGVMAAIGMASSVTLILRFAMDQYKNLLTKAGRECADLQGSSRNVCMISFKLRAINKQIQALQAGKSKCGMLNRQRCQEKINEKIRDLDARKRDLQQHYSMFKAKEHQEQQAQQIRA